MFVDDMYRTSMGNFRGMRMSHMIADTTEELHAMASAIGLPRVHFQGDHYDVAMSKRKLAIDKGAVALTMRELGAKMQELSRTRDVRG